MQNYKSLDIAVIVWATLVNTQTRPNEITRYENSIFFENYFVTKLGASIRHVFLQNLAKPDYIRVTGNKVVPS